MALINSVRSAILNRLTHMLSLGNFFERAGSKSLEKTTKRLLTGTIHSANVVGNYFYENDRSVNQVISGHQDFMQGALGLIGAPKKGYKIS